MQATTYQALRPAHSSFVPIRTLRYHVRTWGAPGSLPPLVLLHGWMDVGASWQFVVDALADAFVQGRHIIAPDWRGFGRTAMPAPCDGYHFADYLADLDRLLDHFAGDRAVDLVGHSMGGNVVMQYAGARPTRVRRLVNLEGFGLPITTPQQAPQRLAQWMDELRAFERGALDLKSYASAAEVAQRLTKTNPRLAPGKAAWLAQHWAAEQADGRWHILGDAAHKITNPQLFRVEEAGALYAAITAPVLAVEASSDSLAQWWKDKYTLAEYHQRLAQVRDCRIAVLPDCGHMLHHDQPEALARLLQDFVA